MTYRRYDLAVGYAGNPDEAEKVVARIGELGRCAIAVGGDVADGATVAGWFDRAEALGGGVDVVTSAGCLALSSIADLDLTVLDDLHRTNVRGTFVVAQQAARRLRAGGALVTLSVLAREMRGRDVTVNAVTPGATATDPPVTGSTTR